MSDLQDTAAIQWPRRIIPPAATQKMASTFLWSLALLTIGILLFMVAFVLWHGLPNVTWTFLTEAPHSMGREGGVGPIILGTLWITGLAVMIAAPIGVCTSIFLTEYTREGKLTSVIRFGADCLAGIPSIIFGLFGYVLFVPLLGYSILAGALTLTLMVLPTIIRTSEEAIRAVPRAYRDVAFGLGSTRWQTVTKVVVRTAMPGIGTGIVLAIGRSISETAALMLTSGSALGVPQSVYDSSRTMALHFYIMSREGISMTKAYATAAVLILAILGINIFAHWVMRRFVARASWMTQLPEHVEPAVAAPPKFRVEHFGASFGQAQVLRNITLNIHPCERLAIIGPAGSGKTTFLRSLNRMNDLEYSFSHSGRIELDGEDIFADWTDVAWLRRRVGMVYAVPTPLPWSIYENIAYGLKLSGVRSRSDLDEAVESGLRSAILWDEVKDRLDTLGTNLSGGQQQRLCLARALALKPEVLLLDEPCSGLDPISMAKIEDALAVLKAEYSIVLVTNNTKQAARASDRTAFFLMGELIEIGTTSQIFTNPTHNRTAAYVTGHFG